MNEKSNPFPSQRMKLIIFITMAAIANGFVCLPTSHTNDYLSTMYPITYSMVGQLWIGTCHYTGSSKIFSLCIETAIENGSFSQYNYMENNGNYVLSSNSSIYSLSDPSLAPNAMCVINVNSIVPADKILYLEQEPNSIIILYMMDWGVETVEILQFGGKLNYHDTIISYSSGSQVIGGMDCSWNIGEGSSCSAI